MKGNGNSSSKLSQVEANLKSLEDGTSSFRPSFIKGYKGDKTIKVTTSDSLADVSANCAIVMLGNMP